MPNYLYRKNKWLINSLALIVKSCKKWRHTLPRLPHNYHEESSILNGAAFNDYRYILLGHSRYLELTSRATGNAPNTDFLVCCGFIVPIEISSVNSASLRSPWSRIRIYRYLLATGETGIDVDNKGLAVRS